MRSNFLTACALLSGLAASHSINLPIRNDSPKLDVRLQAVGGSEIKVLITNQGSAPVRLLKPNTLLEKLPNDKLVVRKAGERLRFAGVDFHLNHNTWKEEQFVEVAVGQTLENTVDVSRTHDLTSGGTFEVQADARIEYALSGETKLHGAIPYTSNTITVALAPGAVRAPGAPQKVDTTPTLAKRSRYARNSCSQGQFLNLTRAAQIGAKWAARGSLEALKPKSEYWTRYLRFNDTSNQQIYLQTKHIVSQRLAQVSADLAAGWISEVHCKNDFFIPEYEVSDVCAAYPDNAIAFTYRATCQIALCKKAWNLPIQSDDCKSRGALDLASTLIHELTHCTTLGRVGLQPATDDFAYDFEDTQNDDFMTPGMALQNAQSSALFAKASFIGGSKC